LLGVFRTRGEIVLARRVVVTGVGLLTPLGIGTELSWDAIRAGRTGIAEITQFNAAAFSCRIAGEVKGFDPANYIEKKEIKKMGRFIQFAIAAADFALKDSGLQVTPEIEEEVGVYIGSGIGGFEVIEREHQTLLEHGPRRISPFFIRPRLSIWRRVTFRSAAGPRGRIRLRPPPAQPARIPSAIRFA
jgi:3-oxoacyl-[acyl-carrier-protein] synthase II